MLSATVWEGRASRAVGTDADALVTALRSPSDLLWVDLLDPGDGELDRLAAVFDLDALTVEDLATPDERPKFSRSDAWSLVVAFAPNFTELGIVFGNGWIATVRRTPTDTEAWSFEAVHRRFERTCPSTATAGFLLYTILDELVDGYLDAADRTDAVLEDLEERIFAEQLGEEAAIQQEIFNVRRDLVRLRRKVVPLRDVVSAVLRREAHGISDDLIGPFQDVFDHLLRAVDVLDSQRELLGNAVDAHLAIISNAMNQVMKKMTSWGALLLGSTLVAGIYGMNFEHMPELHWRFGYLWALLLMVLVTAAGYRAFKRRNWL